MKTAISSAAVLAVASVLCVPSLAMAQPTLNVADTASLIAGGSGVIVSVEITCPTATNNVYVSVSFVQVSGVETASGWAGIGGLHSDITCDSAPHTVEMNVPAFGVNKFQPAPPAPPVTSYASILECPQDCRLDTIEGGYQTKSVQLVQPSASKGGRGQTLPFLRTR